MYPNDWERKVFQSTHIHSGEYSPSRRTLLLRYGKDAVEYEYQAPPELWAQLKGATSPGKFVREVIAPNFVGKKKEK